MRNAIVVWLAIVLLAPLAAAQDGSFLDRLMAEDASAVNAVVMYPEDVREAVFEASTNPGALVRIANLQDRTRAEFQTLVAKLEPEDQKKMWELSRYPDLVAFIGGESKPSAADLDAELQNYPAAVHSVVKEFNGRKRKHVVSLNELNKAANASFENLLASYSAKDAATFKTLIGMPEVLDILTRNIAYTAELGDIYRRNPDGVKARAAEMQLEVARSNAEADNSWATNIQSDPQALAELEQSAADFAKEDTTPTFVYRAPEPQSNVTVTVHYYPYSYWYGYPAYYGYPYWYPRPHWYHTGFYVTANGTVIIVGTPSYHYTHWHFYGYHHHYHYSHLSYHYARHYDHYRHHHNGATDAIRDWERENWDRLPRDWAADRPDGAKQFREFGEKNGDRALLVDKRSRPETTTTRKNIERGERAVAQRRQTAADIHDRSWRGQAGSRRGQREKRPTRNRSKRN